MTSMRTLCLIVVVVCAAALTVLLVYRASQDRREWAELRTFKNRDLYNARYEDRARELARKRLSGHTLALMGNLQPWAVLELLPSGKDIRVLILERAGTEIRCTAFSEDSKLLSSHVFAGGNLIIRNARTRQDVPVRGDEVVEVTCEPAYDGPDIARQYYALGDNGLILVRLEDRAGKVARNVYVGSSAAIGPDPPARTDAEWQQALSADNVSEVLSALQWLGGGHLEGSAKMERVPAVLGYPQVKERLLQLRNSSNPWIAEAAQAALLESTKLK